jgi:putative ABC transport system permease protein
MTHRTQPRTVIVGMTVGLVVTVVSSLLPACKAARVPPMAAVREELARPQRQSLRVRAIAGSITVGVGVAALLAGLFTSVGGGIWFVAIGALVFFVGVSIIAPLAADPVAAVPGWPLPKMFGVAGQLAQDNTRRQPRRTASTASALTIGVALVVFVAVFGASIKSSITSSVTDTFPGDFSVQSTNFAIGVSPAFTDEVRSLSEIGDVSTLRVGNATVDGTGTLIVAVNPATIDTVTSIDVSEGAFESLAETNGVVVLESIMEENGWAVVRARADEGLGMFTIPISQIAALVLLAAFAGVIAAIYPSWKASRLNVLTAISYE